MTVTQFHGSSRSDIKRCTDHYPDHFLILFVLCLCFPGIFLVQEMLQYSILTTTRKLLIVLGLWYVVVGVFIFADSEVLAIMQDIKENGSS